MPALTNHFKTEISTLIANQDFPALKAKLAPWLPSAVAPILAELPIEKLAMLFRGCSKELSAAVFSCLEHPAKHQLLKTLTQLQTAALLNNLQPDDRTAFLNQLPLDLAMPPISLLTLEERKTTQDLLAYPEPSVGRMMTLDFVAVKPEWTVREALDYIRELRFLLSAPETKGRALIDGIFAAVAPVIRL